jgi:hypothetical protein
MAAKPDAVFNGLWGGDTVNFMRQPSMHGLLAEKQRLVAIRKQPEKCLDYRGSPGVKHLAPAWKGQLNGFGRAGIVAFSRGLF